MMKLFYSAGACSLSCHIALNEAGLAFEAHEVDWDENKNVDELMRRNPFGAVPMMVMEDGSTLTQNQAILTFIADSAPKANLLPAYGTRERANAIQWLATVSTDVHKAFGPLFGYTAKVKGEEAQKEVREWLVGNLDAALTTVDSHLAGKDYLMGSQFTVADAYLFTVYNWCQWVKVPTEKYKNLNTFSSRVYQRPAVQKAMKTEGLLD